MISEWSYSRLSTYEQCPRKAKFKYVDRLPDIPGPAAERGNVIHLSIEEFLKGVRDDLHYEIRKDFVEEYAMLRLNELLVEHRIGFTKEWEECEFFGVNVWLRVVYDVLWYDDSVRRVHVIDHKTGKPYAGHTEQLELYSVTGLLLFPDAESATSQNFYIDIGMRATIEKTLSRKTVPVVLEKWKNKVSVMEQDETYAANPGQHCRFCPYAKSKGGPCVFG